MRGSKRIRKVVAKKFMRSLGLPHEADELASLVSLILKFPALQPVS